MPHDRRVTLGRGDHVFDAVVDDLHRTAGLERQQSRRAPRSSRDTLPCRRSRRRSRSDHPHRAARPEQAAHRLDDVEGTLHRAVDRDAAILRHGDHAVGLDVDVLLVAGPVGALDDHEVGAGQRGGGIALGDVDGLEGPGWTARDRRAAPLRRTRSRPGQR